MIYAILIAVLVAADQLVKYLVRANIPLYGSADFIPYVMDLTYVKNTGAAFSLFRDHTWLLTLLSAVIAAALVGVLVKRLIPHPFGKFSLSLILAGAVGNLIDRFFFGFVTDMFRTLFMDFAVFNVADICVTVGTALFAVYFLFFCEKPAQEKEGAAHGGDGQDG